MKKEPFYLPWIGNNFVNSKTKLLVLAESPYGDAKNKNIEIKEIDWLRTLIQQNFATIEYDPPMNLLINLLRALYNKKDISEEERINFSKYIAFTDIVQRLKQPLKNKDDRPNKDDFKNGWKKIIEIIKIIKPNNIIIIGVSSIKHLERIADETNINICNIRKPENKINSIYPIKFLLKYNNETSKCIAIKHTSKFFSWKVWPEYIVKYINLKEIIK